jgi:CDP-glycerol glycerophosphotransferase (TagB/SpsB family)
MISDRQRLIVVVLPYAVSIRDFVHTGVARELTSIPGVRLRIYTQNPSLPELDALRASGVEIAELPEYRDGRLEGLLKRLYPILFSDVFVHVQQSIARKRTRRWQAGMAVGLRRLLGTSLALRLYGRALQFLSASKKQEWIAGNPELVISTRSLVNSLDFPIVRETVERSLPHITVASSWDNFTTKGFFPFPVDRIVVWNRQMANELTDIFEVAADKIVIGGYPRSILLSKHSPFVDAKAYLSSLGIKNRSRFVLYSASYGDLTRTAPGEPPREFQIIRKVATALAAELPDDTCIIVRLHPYSLAEDETYFADIPRMHLFVPGRRDRYVERVMSEADEQHLAAQLSLSECIISMASTITLDALTLGRPILNIAFDPVEGTAPDNVITRFYAFNHFRDLLAAVNPPLATSLEDVLSFVRRCIAGDRDPRINQTSFEQLYVPANSAQYALLVRQTVEAVLDQTREDRR